MQNIDEYERQREIFILVKEKLIWLIKHKTLKAILRLWLQLREISRVRIIEFSDKMERRVDKREKIKLQRAYGECLGTWRRRRT